MVTLARQDLLTHHGLELPWAETTAGGAVRALAGDAGEVGLGQVDARVQVLPPHSPPPRYCASEQVPLPTSLPGQLDTL